MTLGTATVLHEKHPPWSFNGASLDLDFANGRGWVAPGRNALRDLLTVTRASVGYAEYESGVWLPSASGVARITDKGLLVEEARTNSIRNNSMQGAVVGTPGTRPTNWAAGGTAGLTLTTNAVGAENGIDYIEYHYSGTTNATTITVFFESTTGIPALQNEVFTNSIFVSLVAGDFTNITSLAPAVSERNGAGANLALQGGTDFKSSITSSLQRFNSTFTLGNASTAYVLPYLNIVCGNGVAVDFTIRIGWPQLEEGAFVTSPIRTTTAATTRAADVITRTGLSIGSEATLYAEITVGEQSSGFQGFVSLSDGTTANRTIIARNNTAASLSSRTGNVDQAVFAPATLNANTAYKAAISAKANDFAGVVNGGTVGTDVSGTFPSGLDRISVGNGAGGAQPNGYLRRVAYWPSRLSNAQLQALTA